MRAVEQFYRNNIKESENKLDELEKKLIFFSGIRLTIIVLCLGILYYYYKRNQLYEMIIVSIITIVLFSIIAFFHNKKLNEKIREEIVFKYNQNGLMRLNGEWRKNKDNGEEFIDKKHNFSRDLDIFGVDSLFQWINTTNTTRGRIALVEQLKLNIKLNKFNIGNKQLAIRELVEKREFCKWIFVETYEQSKSKKHNMEEVVMWMKQKNDSNFTIKYIPYFFIASTMIFITLAITNRMPATYLLLVFAINYLVVKLLTRELSDVINIFTDNKYKIIQFGNVLSKIQNESFISNNLRVLRKQLEDDNSDCKKEMKKLKDIISWMGDSSGNAYYLIINMLFLSDIFILNNLQQWKVENGEKIEKWLNIVGEFEALASLSNLAFENSEWIYPKITASKEIVANQIGHPLLGNKAVVNSLILDNEKRVALITGSNMSGKSTFLRTIGFNLVLAYLGLPTFSSEFKCGINRIYTCMRTEDNLQESISSFYAEILRVKLVIDAAKNNESVLFLLDEIFKGTNSSDRHEGAKILIDQLVNYGAIGLVSTHDLELCELEKSRKWLINFNFQEYYEENNIRFDYILREGISKTHNAKHLMRLAGIEIR